MDDTWGETEMGAEAGRWIATDGGLIDDELSVEDIWLDG